MTSVHESLTGWETLPAKELANHRAIVVTVNDTVIDGRLIYHDRKTSHSRFETLNLSLIHISEPTRRS